MLTPAESTLLTWLVEFQQRGSNQLTLARKDIAVIVNLLKRYDTPPVEIIAARTVPTNPVVPITKTAAPISARLCIDCGKPTTPENPARCAVVGQGVLHGACADKRGLKWRAEK